MKISVGIHLLGRSEYRDSMDWINAVFAIVHFPIHTKYPKFLTTVEFFGFFWRKWTLKVDLPHFAVSVILLNTYSNLPNKCVHVAIFSNIVLQQCCF